MDALLFCSEDCMSMFINVLVFPCRYLVKLHFPFSQVIVGGSKSQNDRVFFIVAGSCSVSTKLQTTRQYSCPDEVRLSLDQRNNEQSEFANHSLSVHDNNGKNNIDKIFSSHSENELKNRKSKFFTIAKLTEGDYFNVGENLSNLYIITNTRVSSFHLFLSFHLSYFFILNGFFVEDIVKEKKYLKAVIICQSSASAESMKKFILAEWSMQIRKH